MNDIVTQQAAVPTLFDGNDKQELAVASSQAGQFDAEIGRMQYPRVKVLNHGIFYLPVGGDKDQPLTFGNDPRQMFGVVVRSTKQITRVCFDKDYDPTGTTTPTVICRSFNGMKPDGDVAEPVGITCASCKFNQAFSSGNGTKAKKCKYRLPVLVIPATMAQATDGTGRMVPRFHNEVCAMTINSTSILGDNMEDKNLFNLGTYEAKLGTKGAKLNQVMTTFLLDQRQGALCKALFTSSYVLTDADVAELQSIMDDCPYDLDEMLGTVEEDATDAVPDVPDNAQPAQASPQVQAAPATPPSAPAPVPAASQDPAAGAGQNLGTPEQPATVLPAAAATAAPVASPAPAPTPVNAAPATAAAPPPPPPPAANQGAPAAPVPDSPAPAAEPAAPPAANVVASEPSGDGQPGPDAVEDPSLSW